MIRIIPHPLWRIQLPPFRRESNRVKPRIYRHFAGCVPVAFSARVEVSEISPKCVTLQINAAERLAATDREKERHHLQIAAKTLQSCREELRNCIWDLRNQSFDEPDLNRAIARMLHVLVEDIELSIRFDVPRSRLSDNTVHTILKTIRELVVNAVRHGKARSVKIDGTLNDGRIIFSVTDDGTGFDPDDCPGIADGHFGLQGIRERIRQLQGSLDIVSATGSGTCVTVTLNAPTPKDEDKDNS